MTSTEIGSAGEYHTSAWLKSIGYNCKTDTRLPGSTDIIAISGTAKLRVQVKTSLHPASPSDLSHEEFTNITSHCSITGHEAWHAQVQIDGNKNIIGDIKWKKLN